MNPLAKLRVALVLATSTGGVGRHLAAVARNLSQRGVQVVVLGPRATNERFRFAAPFRAVEIGADLRPTQMLTTAVALVRLRRLVRGADVVHAHGFRAALVSALALNRVRSSRRPSLVITFHNAMTGSELRRRVLRLLMRYLARISDTTFVVSPDLAADVENSRRALVAAASAAPVRAADDVRRALDVPDKAAVVLAIGRLHRQKGFDVLVRAAALWPGRRVVVVIAGDGPQRDALSALITQLRVDVRLIGDRTDIADLLRVAEVVAMPSRWEGWPLTAGEVLAAGRPLVATAVGGLPELVGDAAILVPPDDDAALATAIARLLDDAEVAAEYRLRAANRAAELPTDDDVAEQLLACYTALASAP